MASIPVTAFRLTSSAPIHEELAAQVRRLLGRGQAEPGDRLPSARALAAALSVNVNTVLHAYRKLAHDELIELRRGRGATVAAMPSVKRLYHLADELVDEARRLGITRGELAALLVERM